MAQFNGRTRDYTEFETKVKSSQLKQNGPTPSLSCSPGCIYLVINIHLAMNNLTLYQPDYTEDQFSSLYSLLKVTGSS